MLMGLRSGGLVDGPAAVPRRVEVLVRRFEDVRHEIARLAEQAPTQSARFALALLDRTRRPVPPLSQKIAALEHALSPDAAPDLHPERRGELHEYLAEDRFRAGDVERGLECAREAFALARDPDRFEGAVHLLAEGKVHQLERGSTPSRAEKAEAKLAALEEGIAELERRVATSTEDRVRLRADGVIAKLTSRIIGVRLENGESPDALIPLARRVFALWDANRTYVFGRGTEEGAVERVTRILDATGDPEDATRARLLRERDVRGQR
jgi:hypothetical protein